MKPSILKTFSSTDYKILKEHPAVKALKPSIRDLYLHIAYLILNHGETDLLGCIHIATSSNRLQGHFNKSKDTINRYLQQLEKLELIVRVKGLRYNECSRLYLTDTCVRKNKTLIYSLSKISNTIKTIKEKQTDALTFIKDQYEFLKTYDGSTEFVVSGQTYQPSEIRSLMDTITEKQLEDYAKKVPQKYNKTYVVRGLFMIALKNIKTEKVSEKEIKEEYGYETLLNMMPGCRAYIDAIIKILEKWTNSTSLNTRINRNLYVGTKKLKEQIKYYTPEVFQYIIKQLNNSRNVRNINAYLETLTYAASEQIDFEYAMEYEAGFVIPY